MRRNGEGNYGRIPQPHEGRGRSIIDQAGGLPIEGPELRRHLQRAGVVLGDQSAVSLVLTGTNVSTTALSVDLVPGGTVGGIGIPVAASMQATDVAVSWVSSAPSSGWTLTLHKRTGGGTLNEVATFTINTT